MPEVITAHLDLSQELTWVERLVRFSLCLQLSAQNCDLARWRQEWHSGWLARRRIRQMEKSQGAFDLIHYHTQATGYASVSRMRHQPGIVSIDCTQNLPLAENGSRCRWAFGPSFHQDGRVFRAARTITATSKWAADDLVRLYPDCAAKVHVMPYPIDVTPFSQHWIEERLQRARTGAPVRFLFMGGDFPRKGGHDLLGAWARAKIAEKAELTLVTNFPLGERLPMGVRQRRDVRAYSPEWFECWRNADVFVLPTRSEAFGMVFQEAAAAGLPVIGSRINAIPEIVVDGETGRLVPARDVDELSRALQELVRNPETRHDFGIRGRARIASIATPAEYGRRLERLIVEAVGERVHAPQLV